MHAGFLLGGDGGEINDVTSWSCGCQGVDLESGGVVTRVAMMMIERRAGQQHVLCRRLRGMS